MARVLVTRRLTAGGTDPLFEAGHEVVERGDDVPLWPGRAGGTGARQFDGIVCHLTDRIDAAVLQAGHAGRLRVVANAAVGYDNIDVATAHALGIAVCNTPGVLDDTTADLAFLLILAATRLAPHAERRSSGTAAGTAGDSAPTSPMTCTARPWAWLGYGRIGRAVAQRAAGFDMEVIHTSRTTPACLATSPSSESCSRGPTS